MRSAILKSAMVGAVLLIASGTARASELVVVNVPFPFLVNNEMFPAGHYTIEDDDVAGPSVLFIRGMHTPEAAFVLTRAASGHGPKKPALQFERHDDHYRLASVWESPDQGQSLVELK